MVLTVNYVDEEEKFKAKYLDTYGVKTPCVSIEGGSLLFDELLDPFFAGVTFLIKPDRTFWSSYSNAENYHTGLGWYNNAIGSTLNELGVKPHVHNDNPIFQFTVTNGSGSGSYKEGEIFTITAKDSTNYEFTAWVGDTTLLSSTTSQTTTVTMGEANAAVTAIYTEKETSIATNLSGSVHSISFAITGQILSITVPQQEFVEVNLFTANGRLVYNLGRKKFVSGENRITLPKELCSGMFLLSVKGETVSLNKPLFIH